MLLTIDAGNTNTVFALFHDYKIVNQWRCSTNARTGDEYFVWLSTLIGHDYSISCITSVVISSVVPSALFNLRILCNRHMGIEPLVVGTPECKLPVDVRVDRSTQVGADRLVNTVAAYSKYGGNLVVVDFGTATTFDVVDTDGAYIGGIIAPGVDLSIQALHHAAASLPMVGVQKPKNVIGKNTIECMHSGVYWGYVSLIEGICLRVSNELGHSIKVIGTGGLATVFSDHSTLFDHIDTDLTIRGLVLIYKYNKE